MRICVIENVKMYFIRESINRLLVLLKVITVRTTKWSAKLDRSAAMVAFVQPLKCFPVHFVIAIYFWFAISIFYDFIFLSFFHESTSDWEFCCIHCHVKFSVCLCCGIKESVNLYQYMTFWNIPSSCTINKTFPRATHNTKLKLRKVKLKKCLVKMDLCMQRINIIAFHFI